MARLGLAARDAGSTATAAPARPDPNRPPVQDLDTWLKRLEGKADAAAGERVFYHPRGPGCYRCHQVDGRGGRVGPDLSRLASGMDRRRLVQSILQPSLEIVPSTWHGRLRGPMEPFSRACSPASRRTGS